MTTRKSLITCGRDFDCLNDGNHYCLSNTCQKCIDCEGLLHRLSPYINGEKSCAKSDKECSGCLPEYQSNPSASLAPECFPIPISEDVSSNLQLGLISWTLIMIMVIFSSIFIYVNYRRSTKKENSDQDENVHQLVEIPNESQASCEDSSQCERNLTSVIVEQKNLNRSEPTVDFPRPESPTYSNASTLSLHSQEGAEHGRTTRVRLLLEINSAITIPFATSGVVVDSHHSQSIPISNPSSTDGNYKMSLTWF